jgi:hypothetical protein
MRDSEVGRNHNPYFHTGNPCSEMGRQQKKIPFGESAFRKRVCNLLGININTDASTMQLGSVITQGNRPIAFFSRKLSVTQTKYSVTEFKLLAIVESLKEFQGMLWGQTIKVYTDHKNLTQDALGLTSDRIYRWRLLLEEFAPEIVYIKGIHNTVADAISRLDCNPKVYPTSKFNYSTFGIQAKGDTIVKWKAFSKLLSCYNENNPSNETQECSLSKVFANSSKAKEIFPLTTPEIAEAQKADSKLKHCFRCNAVIDDGLEVRLVDDTYVVCKDGKMIIPKPLQRRCHRQCAIIAKKARLAKC